MARDATETRALLIRAGERRFARDGVAGAKLSDIVRDAGQRNDSAVGYHFGSRQGMLTAIVTKHMAAMEADRVVPGPDAALVEVVAAIVDPTAALLATEDGRDFLRIIEQLAAWSGLGTARPNEVLTGTVLGAQLGRLNDLLEPRFGPVLTRERVALLVTFLTAALAERARARENGTRQRLNHERFVQHLVNVLSGALSA
ncbi:TetR/AcrR family transcriptional regulator [Nocardioides marmoriginsengisoli]|uniref:TetR/AcrR family transcriptional regulator n=1 Tax=Nocardioides marmoriginsengisoli TaxID=661483 RepID=A0A3N0CF85_9ACTN|nr:TetR/AcrR family transcriptional regulator [Nocardioides marmoriginsengisoli]RNL62120.1 TetR/AcrR family transcriptional regulator [Nocardioides marmoriginsengisoli]